MDPATRLDGRRATYSVLSTHFAHLDDDELTELLRQQPSGGSLSWWGTSHTLTVGESAAFVKRVPVTDIEHASPWSTRNHYGLPAFYSYGVGSAGFGAFRELVALVKTTNWVLEGAAEGFPLLYHHRLLPRTDPGTRRPGEEHEDYVRYWNSSPAVDRFIGAREQAPYEAVLVLEHVGHTMFDWLGRNLPKLQATIEDLCSTVSFLRSNGVVHFDVHFGNVLTDGERPYLTDFGLWLDPRFQLEDPERTFLAAHAHYDYGEVLWSVGAFLTGLYDAFGEDDQAELARRFGIREGAGQHEVLEALLRQPDALRSDDKLNLAKDYTDAVVRYRHVIVFMDALYTGLRANPRKDTPYDDAKLRSLLADAGVDI